MVQCPSCARQQEPQLICRQCGTPLPVDLDYFDALGLPKKLTIDLSALENTYHGLGRRIHPDRYASSPAQLRDLSLRATALLTKSYRTLREPVSRGLYWLELNGHKLAENNKQVPPELAEIVFEVQEQLADLRAVGADAPAALREKVENRRRELVLAMDELNGHLLANFTQWDAIDSDDLDNKSNNPRENKPELVTELKMILSKIAYFRTLIRDIDRELGNLSGSLSV